MAYFKISLLTPDLYKSSDNIWKTKFLETTISEFNYDKQRQGGMLKINPSYTYTFDEKISIHKNAQKELNFSMLKNGMSGDEKITNPFVSLLHVGSQLLLTDKYKNEFIFIIKNINYSLKENNIEYHYTCQDAFSYQMIRQNVGYEINNNPMEENFIGAKSIDYWVLKLIQPQCHIGYEYIPLNKGLYLDINNNVHVYSSNIELEKANNVFKIVKPILEEFSTTNTGREPGKDHSFFEKIPFSISNASASSALISLGESLGLILNTCEHAIYNNNNEKTTLYNTFFWFEPEKKTEFSNLKYSPYEDIKSFDFSHVGDSLTTVLNVAPIKKNDSIISLIPQVPPFFEQVFKNWDNKNDKFLPGYFSAISRGKTLRGTDNFNSGDIIFDTHFSIENNLTTDNIPITNFSRNKNELFLKITNREGFFDVPSLYNKINFFFGQDKSSLTISYGSEFVITSPQSNLWSLVSLQKDTNNQIVIKNFANTEIKDFGNENIFIRINISLNSSVFDIQNVKIVLDFFRDETKEDKEFALIADECPWLENKIIDFSYFYKQRIITQEEYSVLLDILQNTLRQINGQLIIYSEAYYSALNEKTKKISDIVNSSDAIGATFNADVIKQYEKNGVVSTINNFRDVYNNNLNLKIIKDTKQPLVNFSATVSDYFNKYISSQQRFLKNCYNFRKYFYEKRQRSENDMLTEYLISLNNLPKVPAQGKYNRKYFSFEKDGFKLINSDFKLYNTSTFESYVDIYNSDLKTTVSLINAKNAYDKTKYCQRKNVPVTKVEECSKNKNNTQYFDSKIYYKLVLRLSKMYDFKDKFITVAVYKNSAEIDKLYLQYFKEEEDFIYYQTIKTEANSPLKLYSDKEYNFKIDSSVSGQYYNLSKTPTLESTEESFIFKSRGNEYKGIKVDSERIYFIKENDEEEIVFENHNWISEKYRIISNLTQLAFNSIFSDWFEKNSLNGIWCEKFFIPVKKIDLINEYIYKNKKDGNNDLTKKWYILNENKRYPISNFISTEKLATIFSRITQLRNFLGYFNTEDYNNEDYDQLVRQAAFENRKQKKGDSYQSVDWCDAAIRFYIKNFPVKTIEYLGPKYKKINNSVYERANKKNQSFEEYLHSLETQSNDIENPFNYEEKKNINLITYDNEKNFFRRTLSDNKKSKNLNTNEVSGLFATTAWDDENNWSLNGLNIKDFFGEIYTNEVPELYIKDDVQNRSHLGYNFEIQPSYAYKKDSFSNYEFLMTNRKNNDFIKDIYIKNYEEGDKDKKPNRDNDFFVQDFLDKEHNHKSVMAHPLKENELYDYFNYYSLMGLTYNNLFSEAIKNKERFTYKDTWFRPLKINERMNKTNKYYTLPLGYINASKTMEPTLFLSMYYTTTFFNPDATNNEFGKNYGVIKSNGIPRWSKNLLYPLIYQAKEVLLDNVNWGNNMALPIKTVFQDYGIKSYSYEGQVQDYLFTLRIDNKDFLVAIFAEEDFEFEPLIPTLEWLTIEEQTYLDSDIRNNLYKGKFIVDDEQAIAIKIDELEDVTEGFYLISSEESNFTPVINFNPFDKEVIYYNVNTLDRVYTIRDIIDSDLDYYYITGEKYTSLHTKENIDELKTKICLHNEFYENGKLIGEPNVIDYSIPVSFKDTNGYYCINKIPTLPNSVIRYEGVVYMNDTEFNGIAISPNSILLSYTINDEKKEVAYYKNDGHLWTNNFDNYNRSIKCPNLAENSPLMEWIKDNAVVGREIIIQDKNETYSRIYNFTKENKGPIYGTTNGEFWYLYKKRYEIPELQQEALIIEGELTRYWQQAFNASKYCEYFLPEYWQLEDENNFNYFVNDILDVKENQEGVEIKLKTTYLPEVFLFKEDNNIIFPKYRFIYNKKKEQDSLIINTSAVQALADRKNESVKEINSLLTQELFKNTNFTLEDFIVEEEGLTTYYLGTRGTKWVDLLNDKISFRENEFKYFNGIYLMYLNILIDNYDEAENFTKYFELQRAHDTVWNYLYENYPNIILENVYKSDSANTSQDLLKLSNMYFKDLSYPERSYNISVIDSAALNGYTGEELHVGDSIELNAEELYNEYDNIKQTLSQHLFITDMSYNLRREDNINLTVNTIKYQDKLIQRLVKMMK